MVSNDIDPVKFCIDEKEVNRNGERTFLIRGKKSRRMWIIYSQLLEKTKTTAETLAVSLSQRKQKEKHTQKVKRKLYKATYFKKSQKPSPDKNKQSRWKLNF